LKETTERTAFAKTIEKMTVTETGGSTKRKTNTSMETATTASADMDR
jgi:hypothetical protein